MFDRLTKLGIFLLNDNDLPSLPPRFFEKLKALTLLKLDANPGSGRFKPIAKAGPEGGIEVASGGTVTLGVAGAENGFDDPWGANIKSWDWTQTAGTTVSYMSGKGAGTARPEFTAPSADETLTFTVTVTGQGTATSGNVNRHKATDTVSVRVGTAGVRPMPKSATVEGPTLTLTYDEDLQTANARRRPRERARSISPW